MSRTKIKINRTELESILIDVESKQQFANRQELAREIVKHLSVDASPSVVLLRIKEFKLQPKTPIGSRGRKKGTKLTAQHKKAMQAGRKNTKYNVEHLRKRFPERYSNLLDSVERGSKVATIKAMCLDCSDFQSKEVKHCTVKNCVLYHIRPYQSK